MEGLYRGFECDAQETRGLWIESLPIEVISNRHIVLSENSSAFRMHGFLSHLHSLMVTMSQKSSVPQAAKSVSQALMSDNW
jgi:hypothetical protein